MRLPRQLELSEHDWVDNHVPERLDRSHVGGAEESVWLHEDGHLATVPPPVGEEPYVYDPVHRAIGDLGGELVVGDVQRRERERLQLRSRRLAAPLECSQLGASLP